MWILRLVGPAIFFAIYVYVCHQLIRFAHLSGPETALVLIFTLLPFAIFLGLPLFIWSREHSRSARWVEIYQHLAHTSLSYLSYIICFILLRDILAFFDFLRSFFFKFLL